MRYGNNHPTQAFKKRNKAKGLEHKYKRCKDAEHKPPEDHAARQAFERHDVKNFDHEGALRQIQTGRSIFVARSKHNKPRAIHLIRQKKIRMPVVYCGYTKRVVTVLPKETVLDVTQEEYDIFMETNGKDYGIRFNIIEDLTCQS